MRSILLVAILTLDLVAAGHKGRHGRKKGVQKIKTRPTAERAGVIVNIVMEALNQAGLGNSSMHSNNRTASTSSVSTGSSRGVLSTTLAFNLPPTSVPTSALPSSTIILAPISSSVSSTLASSTFTVVSTTHSRIYANKSKFYSSSSSTMAPVPTKASVTQEVAAAKIPSITAVSIPPTLIPIPTPIISTPSPVTQVPSSTPPSTSSFESSALAAHNVARAKYGASPMTWSTELAAAAQKWANNCDFVHSGGVLGPFGENLGLFSGSTNTIVDSIDLWMSEAGVYDASNPVASHFTQVVWKESLSVGCAMASCTIPSFFQGPSNYFVCEYLKQGNVFPAKYFLENVQ